MSDPKNPIDFGATFKIVPNHMADRQEYSGVKLSAPVPKPTEYIGRPNYCSGAYLANAYGKMVRTACRATTVNDTALCESCGSAEREMRDGLRAKEREAAQPAQDTSKRSRWSR